MTLNSIRTMLGLRRMPVSSAAALTPLVKDQIVSARRLGDDEMAAKWSEAKAFLKKRAAHYAKCSHVGCDVTIRSKDQHCRMHARSSRLSPTTI